ncbi:MAG: hypothetical protein IT462_00045 [Planctomycetes bacterium]|nr:hypothetical protein [Planctomycetota bacterium]
MPTGVYKLPRIVRFLFVGLVVSGLALVGVVSASMARRWPLPESELLGLGLGLAVFGLLAALVAEGYEMWRNRRA